MAHENTLLKTAAADYDAVMAQMTAQRVGPVTASGLAGLALLGIAGLMARRHCHQTVPQPAPHRGSADQDQALATLGFIIGFVITRAMARRIGRRHGTGPKGRGS